MSRKHFKELADTLEAIKPSNNDTERLTMWRDAVRAIASVCASCNPRFDRSRFYDACGMEDR